MSLKAPNCHEIETIALMLFGFKRKLIEIKLRSGWTFTQPETRVEKSNWIYTKTRIDRKLILFRTYVHYFLCFKGH